MVGAGGSQIGRGGHLNSKCREVRAMHAPDGICRKPAGARAPRPIRRSGASTGGRTARDGARSGTAAQRDGDAAARTRRRRRRERRRRRAQGRRLRRERPRRRRRPHGRGAGDWARPGPQRGQLAARRAPNGGREAALGGTDNAAGLRAGRRNIAPYPRSPQGPQGTDRAPLPPAPISSRLAERAADLGGWGERAHARVRGGRGAGPQ